MSHKLVRGMMLKKSLVAVLALGACATTPPSQPAYQSASGEAATAYRVVSEQLSRRMPGADVRPYANCIMSNATAQDLSNIAAAGARAGEAISQVVARPKASQCISAAARLAAPTRAQSTSPQPVYQAAQAQPVFPQVQMPVMNLPSPQISMPGSNRVTCTHVGIQSICR